MSINRLAFLDIVAFDDGKILRAAVLLTNSDTVPIEFQLTDCIRPTAAQKLLYGAIFERHLKVEIFGKPLLNALSEKPDVVVTKDTGFYQYLANALDWPVILISSAKEIQNIAISDSYSKNGILGEFKEISQRQDLIEPFERIKNVVTQVHKQELNRQSAQTSHKVPQPS
jgi:hypothetical protein